MKKKIVWIKINESNRITCISYGYALEDGIDISNKKIPNDFDEKYNYYKYENEEIVFNESEIERLKLEDLRQRREIECFSIINRGQLWYDVLSAEQIQELKIWYQAWLDVTGTLVVPEKPEFI